VDGGCGGGDLGRFCAGVLAGDGEGGEMAEGKEGEGGGEGEGARGDRGESLGEHDMEGVKRIW
jgi:hypothetical protein